MPSFRDIRREYRGRTLHEDQADQDPFKQFAVWFEEVRELEVDPTAMALATATRDGRPSVRMVLLKGVDDRGLVFYTNYESRKARELAESGHASVLFFWRSLERQVRVDGAVEKVDSIESDEYFALRPLESRWSSYASAQSEVIESREALGAQVDAARERFAETIPRPSSAAVRVRVLAGTHESAPRPPAVHERSRRSVASGASGALTGPA